MTWEERMSLKEPDLTLRGGGEGGPSLTVRTPMGDFEIYCELAPDDGALVIFVDTQGVDAEPREHVLRVNVNDGPVFNYADSARWYGEDQGEPAPDRISGMSPANCDRDGHRMRGPFPNTPGRCIDCGFTDPEQAAERRADADVTG